MSPAPTIVRWDLDKTYLRTEVDSIRGLVKVPFETARDKVDVPGVAELLRSLRKAAERENRPLQVFFVSASPPQIGKTIREKLALDGITVDGIAFKDQLHILMRGKFRGLREQTGYKLTELLRGFREAPTGAIEYLFGDDWETDSIIYSLYADLVSGRLSREALVPILETIPVDPDWTAQVMDLLDGLETRDAVRRIFINLERRRPPASFHVFGSRLVPTFNYFQTAACLFGEGILDVQGVERVARALIDRESWSHSMLENALQDVTRRGHLTESAWTALRGELRRRGMLSRHGATLRQRWREWRVGHRAQPPPVSAPAIDAYETIIHDWRSQR